MRARVKIYPIRSITEREPMERPNGISDAEWETMKKHFQESEDGKKKSKKVCLEGLYHFQERLKELWHFHGFKQMEGLVMK